MAYTALNRFAAFGTNNGHNGTTTVDLLNNKEVGIDFAWRSLHTGTLSGKTLTKAFYGKKRRKSYYLGCSPGGRMDLVSKNLPDRPLLYLPHTLIAELSVPIGV